MQQLLDQSAAFMVHLEQTAAAPARITPTPADDFDLAQAKVRSMDWLEPQEKARILVKMAKEAYG